MQARKLSHLIIALALLLSALSVPAAAATSQGESPGQPANLVEGQSNGGGEPLAYPGAYRWQPDEPTAALNILIYAADGVHAAPNTFLDQALQELGLGYTAYYEGDMAGFEAALTGGTWDLVLFGHDAWVALGSTYTALDNYVTGGGRLVIHTWAVSNYLANPLWATLGFTWVSNDSNPPDPVYWWQPGHPVFNQPESVPELTSLTGGMYGIYGQYVEPLAGAEAIAGYTTPGPDPNQAAIVLANDNRTVFKAFNDGQNSADLDGDLLPDGVELWINLIAGIQYDFGPSLSVTPDSLAADLSLGMTETQQITLTNTGGTSATFKIVEQDRGFLPAPLDLPLYAAPTILAAPTGAESYTDGGDPAAADPGGSNVAPAPDRYTDSARALVYYADRATFDADYPGLPIEGFENTLVPDGTVLACDGPFDSATNNACFAPGGILDGIRLMNVTPGNQMVVLGDGFLGNPSALVGPNTFTDHQDLIFYNEDVYAVGLDLWSPMGAATFDVYIYGPGDVLLGQTSVLAATTGSFWGVASSDAITRIRTESAAGDGELFDDIAFGGGGDVPWLSESPISGTVSAGGGQVVVDVVFDAGAVAQPGEYWATLRVQSNDPISPSISIPVTMTVSPSPDWGKLEGTVTGTGYCGGESYPLEDATVVIHDGKTMTLTTNISGEYSIWLEEGTYDVTASADDHADLNTQVTVTGQQTTTLDLALRSLQPCMSLTPPAMEATLLSGTSETQTLTLINDGAAPSEFAIHEMTGTLEILGPGLAVTIQPGRGTSSTAAPDGYVPSLSRSRSPGAHPLGGTVAVFKDIDPWSSTATETILGANGIPYEVHTSAEFGTLDLSSYGMIVISSDQPQTFYDAYALHVADFEDYVEGGGFLNFFAADNGWNGGSLSAPLPGGMAWVHSTESYNEIDDPAHPVVQGVPSPFQGSAASHGHFGNLPADAHVIVHGQTSGQPNLVEYPLGNGWFIAFGQTLEISYDVGWEGGPILPNTLLWGHAFQPWGDVPWVSEDPITGTVPADSAVDVNVTFTAIPSLPLGTYTATLVVKTDDAGTPTFQVPLTLNIVSCVEMTAVDLTVVTTDTILPGDLVELEADIEPYNASKPYSYTVDYDDGSPPVTGSSSDDPLALAHIYTEPGSYTVTVSAWNCGMAEPVMDTALVTVACEPVYGLDFTWLPQMPIVGETVAFTATAEGTPPIAFDWDFDDGTLGAGMNVTHIYTAAGGYTVMVMATNCDGTYEVMTHTLTVESGKTYLYLPIVYKNY